MSNNKALLQALVTTDAEYFEFADSFQLDSSLSAEEEEQLVADTLQVLEASNAEKAELIRLLRANPTGMKSVGVDIAVLVAVTFLLRTHLKVHRNQEGQWEFLAEHKPSDNDLLGSLLTKLQALLNKR